MPIRKSIPKFRTAQLIFIFCLIAVAGRLAVTFLFADNRSLYFEHMMIARSLITGEGYSWAEWGRNVLQPTSIVPPLYVYWCAFFQWISSSSFLMMYIAQAVIAASGCVPAYYIGRAVGSDRIGLLFSLLYAVYPELVYTHSRAVAEFAYVVMMLWMIAGYLYLKANWPDHKRPLRIAFGIGMLSGLAMLTKEAAVIILLAIITALSMTWVRQSRRAPSPMLPILLGASLVLIPWIVRNAIVQGEFIPLRSGLGINIWMSNQSISNGSDRTFSGGFIFSELSPEYNKYMESILPEDEQDREAAYFKEFWRQVNENPAAYAARCGGRLLHWVWFLPGHPLAGNLAYRMSWLLVIALAIPGLYLAGRRRRLDPVFPLILLGYILLYIPVIILPRYRIPTATILLLFAAITIDFVYSRYLSRSGLVSSTNEDR